MVEITLEELKYRLASQFTECEIVDLLELTSFELVEELSGRVEELYEELKKEVDIEEESEDE